MPDYITEDDLIFLLDATITVERINIDDKQMFTGIISVPKGADDTPHVTQVTDNSIVGLFKKLAERAHMLSTLNVD